ncbi:hypothetical protein AAEX28_04895 [Lentisphaerota bacterium WC36G]|nr:hypothetical protein LJT99_07750 [Lentisphaerae bacterium WC36]
MDIQCTNCGQVLEIEDKYAGMKFECPSCSTELIAPELAVAVAVIPTKNNESSGTGVVVAAFICLLFAVLLQFFSGNLLFLLYSPLYLVTFILGIVACCKSRVLSGIFYILGSIITPAIVVAAQLIFLGTAMATSETLAEMEEEETVLNDKFITESPSKK